MISHKSKILVSEHEPWFLLLFGEVGQKEKNTFTWKKSMSISGFEPLTYWSAPWLFHSASTIEKKSFEVFNLPADL